jgi:hypothetical protein
MLSLPVQCSNQNIVYIFLISPFRAIQSNLPVLLYLIAETKLCDEYKLCNFLTASCYFLSLWSKYSPRHSQAACAHHYCDRPTFKPIQNKEAFLYILMFKYFDTRREDRRICGLIT